MSTSTQTTTDLNSASTTFSTRNSPYRRTDGGSGLVFERDGASFRATPVSRAPLSVWEATSDPEFATFARAGTTIVEPILSFVAAPVWVPRAKTENGTTRLLEREERRRVAQPGTGLRTRIFDPSFLERLAGTSFSASSATATVARLSSIRTGDRFVAFWNRATGRFETVSTTVPETLRVETTSAFATDASVAQFGTATATALYFDATTRTLADSGLSLVVADPFGRLVGSGAGSGLGGVGTRAFVRRRADSPFWELLS